MIRTYVRENTHMLFVLAALAVLTAYTFSIPYDLLTDETKYIDEALLITLGQTLQADLRHLFYPLLISIPAIIAHGLGVESQLTLIKIIRVTNLVLPFISLIFAYEISKKLYDKRTAIISVLLIGASWWWLFSVKRVMMDVPSAAFLTIATYYCLCSKDNRRNIALCCIFATCAFFTKFQAAMGMLLLPTAMIFINDKAHRYATIKNIILTFAVATIAFGIIDYLFYGIFLISLVKFFLFVVWNKQEFLNMVGSCMPASWYLTGYKHIFSHILPVFIIVGACAGFIRNRNVRYAVIPVLCIAYIAHLSTVCWKEQRYFITVAPLLSILAACLPVT